MYDDFIIGEINEGVHVDQEINKVICELAKSYYGNHESYGYISHRINNFSIDPMIHHYNKSINNLKCVSIVDPKGLKIVSNLESKFYYQNRFYGFSDLDKAILWTQTMIRQKMLA